MDLELCKKVAAKFTNCNDLVVVAAQLKAETPKDQELVDVCDAFVKAPTPEIVKMMADQLVQGVGPDGNPLSFMPKKMAAKPEEAKPEEKTPAADTATAEPADGLEDHTIAELEKIAAKEKIDLSGADHKADKIAAIRAARKSK